MATPQNGKRGRDDESSPGPPSKKGRQDDVRDPDDYLVTWRYPPEFWDRLSRAPLMVAAIDELRRRDKIQRHYFPAPPTQHAPDLSPMASRELARFARHGGPDLCDLRGYPDPTRRRPASSQGRVIRAPDPTTPTPSPGTAIPKKPITAYHRAFDQHLADHSVLPLCMSRLPRESDRRDILKALAVPRPSLSPSEFSDDAFEEFNTANFEAEHDEDVRAFVIPTVTGPHHADDPFAGYTVFGNLDPLTDGGIAPPKPDLFCGAHPEDLDARIRGELSGYIVPSTIKDMPLLPNFFMGSEGPHDGSTGIMKRQARYYGAIGARGMHALQNYGNDEPVYDEKPYTFTSAYLDGVLMLWAHHITKPTTPGGRPNYHMTQVRACSVTVSREGFIKGVTAFRNARDLAKRYRDSFIQAANERIRQAVPAEDEERQVAGR